jgi:hypothetical protein
LDFSLGTEQLLFAYKRKPLFCKPAFGNRLADEVEVVLALVDEAVSAPVDEAVLALVVSVLADAVVSALVDEVVLALVVSAQADVAKVVLALVALELVALEDEEVLAVYQSLLDLSVDELDVLVLVVHLQQLKKVECYLNQIDYKVCGNHKLFHNQQSLHGSKSIE